MSCPNALCDLGASVSMIPLAIHKRLNLGELKPCGIRLQLADGTVKPVAGILEDIPVKVGKLYIPTDFVVMDVHENHCIPVILGRPFMATTRTVIYVK